MLTPGEGREGVGGGVQKKNDPSLCLVYETNFGLKTVKHRSERVNVFVDRPRQNNSSLSTKLVFFKAPSEQLFLSLLGWAWHRLVSA